MIDFVYKSSYDVSDLRQIVKLLRGEGGCPWDREQTHASIRREFLEEAYEVAEAIDEGSSEHLREELGDVLLQVVFHADIEEDAGRFDLNGVADGVCKKLIARHPHVFGDVSVTDSAQVLQNWDQIKRVEKHRDTLAADLDSVAKSLPALWRAEKIQKKAIKAGALENGTEAALESAGTALEQAGRALTEGDGEAQALGDLLFACVRLTRLRKLDPEDLLNDASDRFVAEAAERGL